MAALSAFVLAGGQSSRMQRDKAFLELNGRTLLARAIDLAHTVCSDVFIVGPKSRFEAWGPVVEDEVPGRGPLAGIQAALKVTQTELNLVLALDTPFLTPAFVRYLANAAEATSAVVTYPRTATQSQPLCAVYRREFRAIAEQSLAQGRNKIEPLFSLVPCRVIDGAELMRLGFDPHMFDNLNTPQQWEEAARRSLGTS